MIGKRIQKIQHIGIILALLFVPQGGYASSASQTYFKAESAYINLKQDSRKNKYRANWLTCIRKFNDVYRRYPKDAWAPAGHYMAGVLYHELYKRSFRLSDKQNAIKLLQEVITKYPQSLYRNKARQYIKSISAKTAVTSSSTVPSPSKPKASPTPKTAPPPLASSDYVTIHDLRYWSNPNYTRIVIDVDQKTEFTHRLLKKDPAIQKPQRLYIDLKQAKLGKDIQKLIPINDNLLKDVRAGQYSPDEVRVVADMKSFRDYKIFSLRNPFRIVIDVWGHRDRVSPQRSTKSKTSKQTPSQAGTLAKQLALGVQTIVIDPGHGGRDYGAPGYLKGIHEKQISLQIGQRLAKKIKQELGCKVILTRNKDTFLTLEERTAIANTQNADLFISIHTNAVKNHKAYGFETYFLNLATDDEAISVAARENATSTKNISDLQTILNDLMQNAKINESSRLANYVQNAIKKHLRKKYRHIKDKGVKQAPFYVLLGAQMPAILVETAFISNPRECKRLIKSNYQEELCNAIIRGIRAYIDNTAPSANLSPPKRGRKG